MEILGNFKGVFCLTEFDSSVPIVVVNCNSLHVSCKLINLSELVFSRRT